MKKSKLHSTFTVALIPFITLLFLNLGCQKNMEKISDQNISVPSSSSQKSEKDPQALKNFVQVNLVGDNDEYSPARIDPALVNGWGVTFSSGGTAWISAEATGKSLVVNKDGGQVLAPVSIPSPTSTDGGHPTGIVFSGSATDFKLPNGNPARFIFAGADGVISGWNGGNLAAAIRKVNNAATAAYLGLALANDAGNNFLYAANFRAGKIDVFNSLWAPVNKSFTDPNLPAGYSPFNIQAIDNKLYVMYAKVGPDGDEIKHPGFGLVDIYNPDGSFVKRFISNGQLNAPWGIAKTPATFYGTGSSLQNTYLVGNFGDGHINAYTWDGEFLGQLRGHGKPIEIEGLWGISFAPSTATTVNPNRLYFAAGPDEEEHGLFGYLIK